MIVRKQTIRFSPDRTPMPKKVKIGYESDNMVERLVFVLPDIAESQTATMMMDGEYANMVTLERSGEDDRYFADMTAERVGAAGEIECYIVIDGENGEVWNSGTFYLATGEVPAVNEELAERYPDAIEQMRTEMATHRVEMAEQVQRAEDAADRADGAADGKEGGYYMPAVDGDMLKWTPSNENMPEVPAANVRGPQGSDGAPGRDGADGQDGKPGADGAQGPAGNPGVHVGGDDPEDPDVRLWIDPEGEDYPAVSYQPQTLTEEQQTQARDNIGAASAEAVGQLSEAIGDVIDKRDIITDGETEIFSIDGALTFDADGYSQEIPVVGGVEHTLSFATAVYDGTSASSSISICSYDSSGAQIDLAEAVPFVRVGYEQMGPQAALRLIFFPNGGWAKFTPLESAKTIKIRAFINTVGTALTERVPEDWTLIVAQAIASENIIRPEKLPVPSLRNPGMQVVSANLFDISTASTRTETYLGKDKTGTPMIGWYLTGAGTAATAASGTGVDSISALIPMTAGKTYIKPIGSIICFFDSADMLTGAVIGMSAEVFVAPEGCVSARMSFKSAEATTMRLFEGDEFKPYEPYRMGYAQVSVPEASALREVLSRNALLDMGEHMRDVAEEANRYTSPDRHTFVFISDTHTSQLTRYVMSLVANMTKYVACSYVAHGGDIIDGLSEPATELRILTDLVRCANDAIAPVLYVKGNHDANRLYANQNGNDAEDYILNSQLYVRTNRFFKDTVVAGNAEQMYFYHDNDETKIRTIFLNSFNNVEDESDGQRSGLAVPNARYGEEQGLWLANVALNLSDKGAEASEWSVITVSHRAPVGGWKKVFESFRAGTDATITIEEVDMTFSISTNFAAQGAGNLVAMFVGDDHYDALEVFEDSAGVYPVIHILNASMARDNVNLPTATNGILMPPVKKYGTATETAFDIVTIDKVNHCIYMTRYGALSLVYNNETSEFDVPAARTRIVDYSAGTYVRLTD